MGNPSILAGSANMTVLSKRSPSCPKLYATLHKSLCPYPSSGPVGTPLCSVWTDCSLNSPSVLVFVLALLCMNLKICFHVLFLQKYSQVNISCWLHNLNKQRASRTQPLLSHPRRGQPALTSLFLIFLSVLLGRALNDFIAAPEICIQVKWRRSFN